MAVSNQIPLNTSVAAPGATVFPYAFKILRKADLLVTVNGEEREVDVHYTVDGIGLDAGGNITFLTPMVGGELVRRRRNMPLERQTDFQQLGDLRSATLNNDQDAPVLMIQQVAADVQHLLDTDPTALAVESAEAAAISEWHANQHRIAAAASEADAEAAAVTAVSAAQDAVETVANLENDVAAIAAAQGNAMVAYATVASLPGTDPGEGKRLAWVYADATAENNGAWVWDGAAWSKSADMTTLLAAAVATKADQIYVDSVIDSATLRDATRIPVVVSGGKVPLWIKDGKLGAVDVTPELWSSTVGRVVGELSAANRARIPLAIIDGKVPLWLDDGALGFSALSDSALDYLSESLGRPSQTSIATSGDTLRKYRSKTAKFRAGVPNTQIRVGMTGDSWTELSTIPAALDAMLDADFAQSASGFHSLGTSNQINGVTRTIAGFTAIDAIAVGGRSLGPDGLGIYTTGTSATVSLSGLRGTQLTIGYWDGDGTFRYRIDGGSWVSVSGSSSAAAKTLQITGLSASLHTIEIDTTPNAGTVELYFVLAESPAEPGITFFKIGNGGSTGMQWSNNILPHVSQWVSLLSLDLLVVILGTNDTRESVATSTPATLAQGIADIVSAHRITNPDLPVIYTFPPIHGEAFVTKIVDEYRAAAESKCHDIGIECYRAYAEWDDHATESSRGMWADTYHLSAAGANRFARALYHYYLEL